MSNDNSTNFIYHLSKVGSIITGLFTIKETIQYIQLRNLKEYSPSELKNTSLPKYVCVSGDVSDYNSFPVKPYIGIYE